MHSQKKPTRNGFPTPFVRRAALLAAGIVVTHAFGTPLVAQRSAFDAKFSPPIAEVQVKRDSMTITLEPLARTEVKLVMKKDQKAEFSWTSDGAMVTYNLHGEGPNAPGGKAHTYKRGESKAEKGEVVALFDGVHGWSFRNTSEKLVKVTVTAWGQFSELKKM